MSGTRLTRGLSACGVLLSVPTFSGSARRSVRQCATVPAQRAAGVSGIFGWLTALAVRALGAAPKS